MIGENIIAVDFQTDENWDFIDVISKETGLKWVTHYHNKNYRKGGKLNTIKRYMEYFYMSYEILINRKMLTNVIAWQQFYGIILAIYCRILKTKKYFNLTILTFIYKKRKGIRGFLYRAIIGYAINSKYIDTIICYSAQECEYYKRIFKGCSEKFRYCLFGQGDINKSYKLPIVPNEKGRLFASGKSNRDYETLISLSEKIKMPLDIICNTLHIKSTTYVSIYTNIFMGYSYYKKLSESFCVILAFEDTNISSGQLVFIEAMQFGKPIITSRSNGAEGYVIDGYNGLVVDKNIESFKNAIQYLKENEEIYHNMCINARRLYEEKFTEHNLAKRIAHEIMKSASSPMLTKV